MRVRGRLEIASGGHSMSIAHLRFFHHDVFLKTSGRGLHSDFCILQFQALSYQPTGKDYLHSKAKGLIHPLMVSAEICRSLCSVYSVSTIYHLPCAKCYTRRSTQSVKIQRLVHALLETVDTRVWHGVRTRSLILWEKYRDPGGSHSSRGEGRIWGVARPPKGGHRASEPEAEGRGTATEDHKLGK